jgi:hypothetical protein
MTGPARGSLVRTLSVLLLAAAARGPASTADAAPGPKVDPQLGPFVRAQIQRAAQRLESAPCALVLGDFLDPGTGRPLSETLAASNRTAAGHVAELTFRPGPAQGPCREAWIAAYTSPRSRVVHVCPDRFRWFQASKEQNLPVTILIHETLHTLGLGEDPPTSEEITAVVEARCGR